MPTKPSEGYSGSWQHMSMRFERPSLYYIIIIIVITNSNYITKVIIFIILYTKKYVLWFISRNQINIDQFFGSFDLISITFSIDLQRRSMFYQRCNDKMSIFFQRSIENLIDIKWNDPKINRLQIDLWTR